MSQLVSSPLGKKTTYSDIYDPNLLHPIERIAQNHKNSMFGYDLWHLYELSWLDNHCMPHVAVGNIIYMSESPKLIESKSLKLYLNSFNNSRFVSKQSVVDTMEQDLSNILDTQVFVKIFDLNYKSKITIPDGLCIDNTQLEVDSFNFSDRHKYLSKLVLGGEIISEKLYSNLLRSNCPITNQPDWGTITIEYIGNQLSREQLLHYIFSYRLHNDFHEHCVENIYSELMEYCQPMQLRVYANYTRRGGIDINPYRSSVMDFDLQAIVSSFDRFIRQ